MLYFFPVVYIPPCKCGELVLVRNFRLFEKKRGHRRTGSRLFANMGEAVFFAVMLVVGIVGIVLGIVWLIVPEWRANHDFAETTCTVEDRRIVEPPGRKGLYRPEIQIKYTVNQTFLLYTYDIHHFDDIRRAPLLSREEALAKINRFAVGETCACWYDPGDPSIAVVVRGYQWWIWPALVVPASFVAIGAAGLVYAALYWGKSAERRAAAVRKLPAAELFDLPPPADPRFPYIPDCSEITSSPGTRLAYRLPLAQSPGWTLFGLLAAAIIWNAAVSVFIIMAARSVLRGSPDWLMMLFILPFLGVGAALVAVFARQLRRTARIGPTLLEVSDHPLLPGGKYRVFLSQTGNLTLKTIEIWLICEEEAVFRQGTNARTETREVVRQAVYSAADAVIQPSEAMETECELPIPASAMHSFRANHNQLQWKLVVRSKVADWPPLQRTFPVVVHPCAIDGARGGKAMNGPEVLIRLDDNGRAYLPGDCLSGEYRIEGIDEDNLEAVEVSVLWRTEGKGDEDLAVHEFWRKDAGAGRPLGPQWAGGETADPARPDRFSTTLPRSPLSYDGQIVKIHWCVRVRVMFKRGRDLVADKVFRLGNVPPAKPAAVEPAVAKKNDGIEEFS